VKVSALDDWATMALPAQVLALALRKTLVFDEATLLLYGLPALTVHCRRDVLLVIL